MQKDFSPNRKTNLQKVFPLFCFLSVAVINSGGWSSDLRLMLSASLLVVASIFYIVFRFRSPKDETKAGRGAMLTVCLVITLLITIYQFYFI